MTDKRKRFSADDIVDSLKQTGSSLRSVAGEFVENAAQNYHDRDAIGTAKNAARQTAQDFRGIDSFDDLKETGAKLWKRGKYLGSEFGSELRDAVAKTRDSEAVSEAKARLRKFPGRGKDADAAAKNRQPRIIEGEVVDVDGHKPD